MDCVGIPARLDRYRVRRPSGLTRPRRVVPLIGEVELVRQGNSHSWEANRQLARTTITRIAGLLSDDESELTDERFVEELPEMEAGIRQRLIDAWCGLLAAPHLAQSESIPRVHELVFPYRIERLPDGFEFAYDCTDVPGGSLHGVCFLSAKVASELSIIEFAVCTTENAVFLQSEAYRQRLIPNDCGFVQDSVADQLIASPCWDLEGDEKSMLLDSIRQTRALLEQSTGDSSRFLSAAHLCLMRLYRHHQDGSVDPQQFGEP